MLTNTGQSDLLWNFGCRCDPRGIPWKNGTVVYALDSEIETTLRSRGVTTWHPSDVEIPSKTLQRDLNYGGLGLRA